MKSLNWLLLPRIRAPAPVRSAAAQHPRSFLFPQRRPRVSRWPREPRPGGLCRAEAPDSSRRGPPGAGVRERRLRRLAGRASASCALGDKRDAGSTAVLTTGPKKGEAVTWRRLPTRRWPRAPSLCFLDASVGLVLGSAARPNPQVVSANGGVLGTRTAPGRRGERALW